ncbi:MAG: hypothetical protein LBE13_05780 [Bacteroidales bacterium]|jgi:hypothetical protein|nr:hypothetical protein [Bacteroidales bacterium]
MKQKNKLFVVNKKLRDDIWKHVLCVCIFALVTLVYFKPLLEGKDVRQSDMMHGEGMMKELKDYHEQTGDYTYWSNAMFSGVTAAYLTGPPDLNIYYWIDLPVKSLMPYLSYAIIFMMLVCFYITFILLGFDIWIALGASLAYAFGSYNLIIIEAGHITKAYAIAMIPLVMGGLVLAYQKSLKAGFFMFMIGLGLLIAQNHLQITYYTLLMAGIYVLVVFGYAIFERAILDFIKRSAVLLVAIVLAIIPNLNSLYVGYDYSKESMRGKSELEGKASTGLNYDYAFAWSYGIKESLTLLVPNVMGGSSTFESMEQIEKGLPNTMAALRTQRFNQDPNQILQQSTPYWGDQPFTSGPVYAGAIIVFLFVLSLFLVEGRIKTWAIIAILFSLFLAWGKNFPWLNNWMFDNFPFYNKFRTPSMSLVITTFTMVFFSFWGLKELLNKKINKEIKLKYLYISTGITAGICLVLAVIPNLFFEFISGREAVHEQILSTLQIDREALCSADAWRSFLFIVVAAALLWLLIKEKIQATYVVIAISVLSFIDLWVIDKRYLNDNDFEVKKNAIASQYAVQPVDLAIKKDTTLGYRVLNLADNPFNDSRTSYHHHSIGGYHPAKIRRYQELIDSLMSNEINYFATNISTVTDDSSRKTLLNHLTTLNMLNAKYFIFDYSSAPFINTEVLGSAWFVDNVCMVNNANEELDSLKTINPAFTAVVNKEFSPMLSDWKPKSDTNSEIVLKEKIANKCVYTVSAKKDELAVFSEVYYPKYWKIDIDGKPANMFRANYTLRAMFIPQGEHTVTFQFEPTNWLMVRKITLIASIFIILLLLYTVYHSYKNHDIRQLFMTKR